MVPGCGKKRSGGERGRKLRQADLKFRDDFWIMKRPSFPSIYSDLVKLVQYLNQRVISNTVEQIAIFVPLLVAIALRLPASQLRLLPITVTLWCAGRLMFWIGYHIAPHWRGHGFDWTFLTTSLLAGWFVVTLF